MPDLGYNKTMEVAMENEKTETLVPTVGMLCTLPSGNDRYPGKIVEIKRNGRQIIAQDTSSKREDLTVYNMDRKGVHRDSNGQRIILGEARFYQPPEI